MSLEKNAKVFVAGHQGMVGSAIVRKLVSLGFDNILVASRSQLDLLDQAAVAAYLNREQPEIVILAAARVGGISANMENPGKFLYENLVIQGNVIHHSHLNGVSRIVFLGSSCVYPKACPQPMKEEYLLTGPLEPTNEGYAIAKIAGLKMMESYHKQYGQKGISLMPCNLYGPNDSFDLRHSHVLSALVKRFADSVRQGDQQITLWGTGIARREFMHVDDMAEATLFMLEHYDSPDMINVGWGEDISIKDLAALIAGKTGFTGEILWDNTKPDGMLRKCMDVTRMRDLGFTPKITLEEGVDQMITLYKNLSNH